ncbi:MAG: M67 family metallopeptidase [Acidimicrobiales bacterium]
MILRLTAAVRDDLIGMARAALPNEACGYLAGDTALEGDVAGQTVSVVGVYPIANAAKSPVAFVLDPAAMLAAEDSIDRAGRRVVGLVHSHPTSRARPSPRDLSDASTYDPQSHWVHVIVSLQGFAPTLSGWRYRTGEGRDPEELQLEIVEST